MEKCRLRLVGITYNQIESGVYAVVLQEEEGTRRIPIVIGYPEAQAIECKLQEVRTPRPLTHDLMANMLEEFGIVLHEVNIDRLPSGVFAAELLLEHEGTMHRIDSRSSDAIALAIRVGAPIYTTREVLDEAGFEPEEERNEATPKSNATAVKGKSKGGTRDLDTLRKKMQEAAEAEDYEEAARLKAEIDALENNKTEQNPE